MNDTYIEYPCIFTRYRKARFCIKDCLPKYSRFTLNLEKIQREDLNMRINKELQNDNCKCSRCNPNTSN
jgi:hypothetical protein